MVITKETSIHDLLQALPASSSYFMRYGITCLSGGAPKWGSIEELAKKKGYTEEEIIKFAEDLDKMLQLKRQKNKEKHGGTEDTEGHGEKI